MAESLTLPAFPPFLYSSDPSTAGLRWDKWLERFEILLQGLNIEAVERKRGLLVTYVGDETYEIYIAAPKPPAQDPELDAYEKPKLKLKNYFASILLLKKQI